MANNLPNKEPGKEPGQSGWQMFAAVGSLGMQMGTCIVGTFFAGLYLDRWLGAAPWLMILLTLLGVAAAFKVLFEYTKK